MSVRHLLQPCLLACNTGRCARSLGLCPALVAIYAVEHVPAHLAMMPYALKALGYFLGTPGARFPSDCILTCKVTAVLFHSGNHEAAQQMTGLRCS